MRKTSKSVKKRKDVLIGSALAFLFLLIVGICLFGNQTDEMIKEDKEQKDFVKIAKEEKKKGPDLLKKKYKDMIGWIEIPDTEFSYPVMQTGIKKHREKEPEFYLHADVKGEYSFIGTPFLDSRCNLDSDNLIIYGHNIRGGRMFGLLHGYRKTEYYKEHPTIYFTKCGSTKEEYDIVSVMLTDINSFMYTFTDIYTDTVYKDNIEKLLTQSIYETEAGKVLKNEIKDVDVEELFHMEKFITLSTCRTGEGKEKRLLIIAKKRGLSDE